MAQSIQDFHDDPRNAHILISVSVFDSGFVLGDGVWEGLRVEQGHPLFLDAHLDRLYEGACALMIDIGLDRSALAAALYRTLQANGMAGRSGVHIRLMITRGVKRTPYQDPRVTVGPATVVIVPSGAITPERPLLSTRTTATRFSTARSVAIANSPAATAQAATSR